MNRKRRRVIATPTVANHQKNTKITPPVSPPGGHQNGERDPPNADYRTDNPKHDSLDWVNLIVLLLTFLAAGGAAYEAKRLADQTSILVSDAAETAERQLRAYLGIAPNNLKLTCLQCVPPIGEVQSVPLLNNNLLLLVENYGQTPAYQTAVCWDFVPVSLGANLLKSQTSLTLAQCDKDYPNSPTIPSIGGKEARPNTTPFNEKRVNYIQNTEKRTTDLFLIGQIKYLDIFDKLRTSYFCYQYFPRQNGLVFGVCAGHNYPGN